MAEFENKTSETSRPARSNAEQVQQTEHAEKENSLSPPPFQLKIEAPPATGGPTTEHQQKGSSAWSMPTQKKETPNQTGLTDGLKNKMEQSFGVDFSDVRIHKNSNSAERLGALAYTQGTDIHLAPGQEDQSTVGGQELIGHELAHVVQQKQGRVQTTHQEDGQNINDAAHLENEADQQAAKAVRGGKVNAGSVQQLSPANQIQKKSAPIQMRRPLPGPDQIDGGPSVDPISVFETVMTAARRAKGGHADDARSALEARLMPLIAEQARHGLSAIPINVYNTTGFNHTWTGTIMFYMGDHANPVGGLDETVGTGGNSGSSLDMGVTNSTSTTNSASATGGVESSAGVEAGGLSASQGRSASATGSTSSTDTRTERTGATTSSSRTSSASSLRRVQLYESSVIAYVSINAEYDVGWNPITWGGGIGDALTSDHGSAQAPVGSLTYKRYGGQAG